MAPFLCLEKDQSETAPEPSFTEEQHGEEELITGRGEVQAGGRTTEQLGGGQSPSQAGDASPRCRCLSPADASLPAAPPSRGSAAQRSPAGARFVP